MRLIWLLLTLFAITTARAAPTIPHAAAPQLTNDADFQKKLHVMLARTDKSIKILRQQITQNQSAPFLANLYLQLGDLLNKKSTTLYYLEMEHNKGADAKSISSDKFSPVVTAEQQAIAVYEQILRDFPKFDGRKDVMFRLAEAQKSIDEGPAFVVTAQKLIAAYPDAKETVQVRLLLGQYFFDMQDFDQALQYLKVIQSCQYPYERNAARYRIGLIDLEQSKPKDALDLFAQVATDSSFTQEDNPKDVSLQNEKTKQTDLKREALIDSIRAYTDVYTKNPDPVAYYSKIAPTEELFQETIEKLAYRYVYLKQYNFAIDLLRTLCERLHDPQRIVNIYHQVLLMIPLKDRINIPVSEMRFVLEKYNYWSTHYAMTRKTRADAYGFFEKQIRDLGTRAHQFAKQTSDAKLKQHDFKSAEDFYVLYLGFFGRGPQSVKVAIDLADVYYNEGDYFDSGSYYLRIDDGEFGKPTDRAALLQNAILALQKPSDYSFYQQMRTKGLLIQSIKRYMALDPKQRQDDKLSFTLAKTIYEQGYYDTALNDLLNFMKRFPNSKHVSDAADLILNYFNTTADFKNLALWSQRMLALNIRDSHLRSYLKDVHSKALLRRLDEQVECVQGYNLFNQGKSYLQAALSIQDSSLRSVALQQALARSKSEKDINTFLKAGYTMARAAKTPAEHADILNSMANETLTITRFYEALKIWKAVLDNNGTPEKTRREVYEKSLKVALMLRDFRLAGSLARNPLVNTISPATRQLFHQEFLSSLDSPVTVDPALAALFMRDATNDNDWVALFKAQYKLPQNIRSAVLRAIANRCHTSLKSALCRWFNWQDAERDLNNFNQQLAQTPATFASLSSVAMNMNGLLMRLKAYQGSGDPQLDILLSLADSEVYSHFADFLNKVARQSNSQVQGLILQKASESSHSAAKSQAQCQKIISAASLISPTNRACAQSALPSLRQALSWSRLESPFAPGRDPRTSEILEQEKDIFANHTDWHAYFNLAKTYLKRSQWNHAAATSVYGLSTFSENQEEFNAILGCSVMHLGLLGEAQFLLKGASNLDGYQQRCQQVMTQKVGAL